VALFDFLPDKPSLRKMRLLACACARRLWPALVKEARLSIEASERYADGLGSRKELRATRGPYYSGVRADNCASLAARPSQGFQRAVRGVLVQGLLAASADPDGWVRDEVPEIRDAEMAAQATLVRDVFGNPFRPASPDSALRSVNAVSLARAAYDERLLPSGELDRVRLGVMADALEDAGCADIQLLGHLRGPGPHVRGCWALDLVLGKA
jgi:hypothetical protein